MWRSRTLAVLLVLAAAGTALAQPPAQRYTIGGWTLDDGLPNNALTQILPASDGYLWIATDGGVVRFDGMRFTPVASGLPNSQARALLEDRRGRFWIGMSGYGVVRLRDDGFDHFTPANGLAGQDVADLDEDTQGRIWVATESGISVIDDDGQTTLTIAAPGADNRIRTITRSSDGRLWIASNTHICEGVDRSLRCSAVTREMGQVHIALQDRAGRIWAAGSSGVFRDGRVVQSGHATMLFEAGDGSVWAGFFSGDVAVFRGDVVEWYRVADGMPAGLIVAVAEDAEGSVWIGSYNAGFSRLRPKRVRMFTMADGLPAAVVGSIVQDARGTIWAGTDCGPVAELRGDRFVPRFAEYTKDACAWVLLAARDGALWIGTRGHGVFRWSAGRMQHFDRAAGLADGFICSLFEDRHGVIWIGTQIGGMHRYEDGRLSRAYREADGLASHHLASIAEDAGGRVWIGSNGNGLSVYEAGRFRFLPPPEGPPTRNVAGLLFDSRGDLWIGSAADGLFRRRGNRYEPFGLAQGLGDRLVALYVEDRDANFWVATTRGIKRLARENIEKVAAGRAPSLEPIILDKGDGVLSLEGSGGGFDPSGLRDRDGRIWISTIGGIAVIDPASFPINRVAPAAMIEAVTLGEHAVAPAAGLVTVPAGTAAIDIAYTSSSRLDPSKNRFRYRLAGQDPAWRDVGNRRTGYFTSLPPGSYTFEVMASNNDGVWGTAPASLGLVVLPFWWQRNDVRSAGLTLLLGVTGLLVYTVAQRRARRRMADLERENALERERTRIARDLHDDLGARLTYIAKMAETPALADRVSHSAKEAVQTLDELVWTVNAGNDSVDGFASYACRLAEEYVAAAGLRLRLQVQTGLGAYELAADARRHLYLAFKEALNNALKHARATTLHIEIAVTDNVLRVVVADNGRGVEGPGDPTGNGLGNMRERMSLAGGSLRFDSTPGAG